MTASGALAHLREQGHRIRTQTFYRLWGETADAAARSSLNQAAPLNRRPTSEEITPFTAPRARGFLYTIDIAVRDRLTGEVFMTPSGYRSDRLVSRGRALRGAIEAARDAQEINRESFGGEILGGTITQVREFVPEDEGGEVI